MKNNLIIMTDSYKASMHLQYPPNTQYVYSYIESRGGLFNSTMFFGLQAFIKEYFMTPITMEDIDEAEEFWLSHGEPFCRENWEYILKTYNGFLPICIKAVKEGTLVPTGIPLVTIVNTDPNCYWLTTYVETPLLRAVWYPTTVATYSFEIKRIIKSYLDKTSDDPSQVMFKLHDFGARGVSSHESAMIGGMAHLVNFRGSDTAEAIVYARRSYNEKMAGFSIPASEHSTITSWGKPNEIDAYRNMIKHFGKTNGIFACVSDSYDIFNATENIWGTDLKVEVENCGSMVVIRPDSGDPLETPLRVVQILAEKFGTTINSKGYKVLNNVRVIQGDGIDIDDILAILANLEIEGYAADNIAFGMGGNLLQNHTRDEQKFAMKCSAIMVDNKWRDVYKEPVGQPDKKSKRGRFQVTQLAGKWTVHTDNGHGFEDELQMVFNNGVLFREQTFQEIRDRADSFL